MTIETTIDADFATVVKGTSMEPTIHDGEIVLIKRQSWAMPDDICFVIVGNDPVTVTLKHFHRYLDGSVSLVGDNPSFQPLRYTAEQAKALNIRIAGKYVGKYSEGNSEGNRL